MPSAGATQRWALSTHRWPMGSSHEVSSSVPGLTLTMGGLRDGSWKMRVPQVVQKRPATVRPLAAARRWVPRSSAPVTRKPLRATGMDMPKALPDWVWQSAQWQA